MSLQRFFTILVLLGVALTAGLLLSLPALAAAEPVANSAPAENGPHRFAFQGCLPAVVTVTSAGDNGVGSLRQAIADVCDGGTINFASSLAGQTIGLTSAELTIARTVTIANPNAPGLAVSGNNARRVFYIESSGVVTLSQLNIVSGTATGDYGGGIYNAGRLTIQDSTLSGNSASYGGGIYNYNTLTVQGSTFSGNSAQYGGGILNNGTLTVQGSTFSGNSANYYGGGGIYNNNGTLAISSSTLTGNSAQYGGGIYNAGRLTIQDSTLSGNSASGNGGGIDNHVGTLSVLNSTLSGNSAEYDGGGITNGGTLNLVNTIIAGSLSGDDCHNSSYSSITADHSLVEASGDFACGLTDGVAGNIVGLNPLLSPLGAYGGETQTHALLPGSPALDGGQNCLAADQRGVGRPQPSGGACDIGAFESRGFRLTYGAGSGQSAYIYTPFAAPLSLAVSSAAGEPVDGGVVTFAGPLSGAGVTPVTTTATIAGGAVSHSVTANGTGGSYTVTASAAGAPASVDFALTNTCGAQVTVTSTGDAGVGSLRQAIAIVCDGGTIDFAPGLAGQTIGLTSAELTIARTVTIANPNAPGLAVSGNNARRVFYIESSGVVTLSQLNIVNGTATGDYGGGITNAGRLTIQDSTLSGNSASYGGGITNNGTLTVLNSTLSGNSASEGGGITNNDTLTVLNSTLSGNSASYGGGITNAGRLTIQDSTLSGNSASEGGGITNYDTLTVQDSTLSGNSADNGGGITNNYGTLTISNSALSSNSANYYGGGVYNNNGTLSVSNGALTGNSATYGGGGIYNEIFNAGTLTVQNSILSGNSSDNGGGGIFNSSGTLTVQGSTFSGNSAPEGGGIYNVSVLTVQNSTLSGNSAEYDGGGITNGGTLTVLNSTLSGNSALYGGGSIFNNGTLNLANTIIAGSPSGSDCYNAGGTIAADHNLVEASGVDACGLTDGVAGNIVGLDPLLSPLGAYGGETQTHALLPGSPALDGGQNYLAADQRGVARPQPAGGGCDIGAFESRGFSLAYDGGSGQSALVNTSFAAPLSLTVTANNAIEPVDGGEVTFVGPPSGAGVTPVMATATIAGGAVSHSVTANGTAGSYTVSAATPGGLGPAVSYALTNTPPPLDITVLGNGLVIADDDTTPSAADDTDFGNAPLASGQITHTFTISNSGTVDLYLTGTPLVSISGPAAGDFMVVGDPTTPVAAGSATTFQVRFTPGGVGTRTATVTVASDDPDETIYDFAIQGEGLLPTVSLSVSASSGSEADQTTITITATASANVSGAQTVALGVGGTGITAGDYSLSSATITIPDGQSSGSVTFTVQDDALAEAAETAILTLGNPSAGLLLGDPISQTVTIADNDANAAGYIFTPATFSLAEGSSQVVSLTLGAPPTAEVTVSFTSSDLAECSVSPASVTLTAATWQSGASFTVSGVDDGLTDGDQPCAIVTTASTTDSVYSGLDPADISLTVIDGQRFIYLPLILNNFTAAPDLVVDSLAAGSGGPSLTIRNAGNVATPDAFWVDVYFDPTPAPPPLNRTWQSIAQAGAHWGVTGSLAPGETLTLTIGGPYYSGSSSSFPAGAQVYAYVDSINYATSYGNVMESNEANNVFGPVVSTTGAGAVTPPVKPVSLAGLPER